jgi:hypothetical protein
MNLKGSFMYNGCQFFSPTLLIKIERSLLKRCVTLYALTRVWRRGEKEKHIRMLTRRAGQGVAWRDDVMGAGARRAREWSTEIRPKTSQIRGFLLLFILL